MLNNDQLRSPADRFERALALIAARVFVDAFDSSLDGNEKGNSGSRSLAVAYSGGLDSSVLLHLVSRYAAKQGLEIWALHVHHGLSTDADAWLAHCRAEATRLNVRFDSRQISIDKKGQGIENAARLRRYEALGEMCRTHGVPLLLTAHHEDDQAETVMLQLLRGAGVAGLSGMDEINRAPALLGDEYLWMARPLLTTTRIELERVAADLAIANVEDQSNFDTRYARNALRQRIMPVIASEFPGFTHRLARAGRHAQSAQRLLIALGKQDHAACAEGDGINVEKLRALDSERSDNMLRYWFGSRGVRMPSSAWLTEMRTQLLDAKADAQILIRHADCDIHRHRNRVVMTVRRDVREDEMEPITFRWTGEASLRFDILRGTLHFDQASCGFDAAWLALQPLFIQLRGPGWKLKLAPNRSTRSLKYHYQAADIPAWARSELPLVAVGKNLLYAAGIGMDCHYFAPEAATKIALRWEPDLESMSHS